eukprot:jgi/Psemu1/30734/gm1.30734_g
MARTVGSVNKKCSLQPPEIEYEQPEYINKLICYNFWIHLQIGGAIGWYRDPKQHPFPASVEHQRSLQYILSSISENQFKYRANIVAVLESKSAKAERVHFSDNEDNSKESNFEEKFKMTKPILKTPPMKRMMPASPTDVEQLFPGLSINKACCAMQTIKGFISYAHISGCDDLKQFLHENT